MRSRSPIIVLAVTLVLGAGGCDEHDQRAGSGATISPASPSASASDCPNQEQATESDPQGSLSGDISGDGSVQEVFLYRDDEGEPGCDAFLAIGDDGPVVAVAQEGMSSGSGLPNLVGLAQIDGRQGLDVVVRLLAGASTEFVGVFSAFGGQLERVRVEDSSGLGDLFPYGGGVTHLDAIDCDEEGSVVISSAVSEDAESYVYTRTVYEFDDGALVPAETSESTVTVEELQDIPEFARSPFGSCPGTL